MERFEVDKALRNEIGAMLEALRALQGIVLVRGLNQPEKVADETNELISQKYEPYFCGNAALHISSRCLRCGRCCRDEESIAVSIEDCRKIAKHLGMSQKKFLMRYTKPHNLKGPEVGSARLIRKAQGVHCPFYDSQLPGCSIHKVKPQVCMAALYLSKMNLMLCKDLGSFSVFPDCPADIALRAEIDEFWEKARNEPETIDELKSVFLSSLPEVRIFSLLLRLKGMEIYFGPEVATPLARKLGLQRMPDDKELQPAAFLYAATLLETQE